MKTLKTLNQSLSKSSILQYPFEGLLQHRWLGPTLRISDSADLGWGLGICISKKFPSDAAIARGHTLKTIALKYYTNLSE